MLWNTADRIWSALTWIAPAAGRSLARQSDCKLLCSEERVQLIVFFEAIRETLTTKIYARDKKYFCSMKTKGQFWKELRA
jgi:hypothetical protein